MRRISAPLSRDDKLRVVGLDEVKAHVRLPADFTAEDDLLKDNVETAYDFLSGPDGWLGGYCLLEETYQVTEDIFAAGVPRRFSPVAFPLRPVTAVDVEFALNGGAWSTLDASNYSLSYGDADTLSVTPFAAFGLGAGQIRLTATAGVAMDDAKTIPSPIRQSMKMLVAELYRNREVSSDIVLNRVSFGLVALAGRYRFEPDHS